MIVLCVLDLRVWLLGLMLCARSCLGYYILAVTRWNVLASSLGVRCSFDVRWGFSLRWLSLNCFCLLVEPQMCV